MTDHRDAILDGDAITRLRVQARLSIRRLAELVGVSQTTIRGIENGRNHATLTLETTRRLAAALDATPQALLLRDPDHEPPTDDDVTVEAALAMLGRTIAIYDLATALGWSHDRTRAALARTTQRLQGSGQTIIDAGWQKARLAPATHTLTHEQQVALHQLTPRTRGLTASTARVLHAFIHGDLDTSWHQHASGDDRAALGQLLKQGLLTTIIDDNHNRVLALSPTYAYLDPTRSRRIGMQDPRPQT